MSKLFRTVPLWPLLPLAYGGLALRYLHPQDATGWWLYLTLLLIVAGSSIGLFTDERPYSFNRMFWLFLLLIFGLVPAYQLSVHTFPWAPPPAPVFLIKANIVVLLGMAGYQLARWVAEAALEGRKLRVRTRISKNLLYNYYSIGMAVLLLLLVAYVAVLGVQNIWLKGQIDFNWVDRISSGTYLLAEKLVRGPVLYLMLLTVLLYRCRSLGKRFMLLVLGLCCCINFPLAMPRYLAATVCGALLLSFDSRRWLQHRQAFSWLVLLAWVLVYPLIGLAKWEAVKGWKMLRHGDLVFHESFVSGDFDSYATLARTIEYTQVSGTTQGRQLATSLLFFVPRSYWPGKSIGSGALVYKSRGSRFTNMASPFLAEGYIDFGWIGAFVYAFLIGFLAVGYDRYYWHWRLQRAAEGDFSFLSLMYPALMILFFFLLRGDLLSSLAAILGLMATAWLMHLLLQLKLWRT